MSYVDTLFNIASRSALITGASSGLGAECACTLAAAGIGDLVLAARREQKLEQVKQRVQAINKQVHVQTVAMDVSDVDHIKSAFREIDRVREGKPCDILVNNAGISSPGTVLNMSPDKYDQLMNTNQRGAFFVAQEAARRMVDHNVQGGSIINVASILGLRAGSGLNAYAMSKAALVSSTKSMALDLIKYGVRVNAICPGYIRTEMNDSFFDSPKGIEYVQTRIPAQRVGAPADLAGALLLLASDAGSFMNGSIVAVDGGHLCSSL